MVHMSHRGCAQCCSTSQGHFSGVAYLGLKQSCSVLLAYMSLQVDMGTHPSVLSVCWEF